MIPYFACFSQAYFSPLNPKLVSIRYRTLDPQGSAQSSSASVEVSKIVSGSSWMGSEPAFTWVSGLGFRGLGAYGLRRVSGFRGPYKYFPKCHLVAHSLKVTTACVLGHRQKKGLFLWRTVEQLETGVNASETFMPSFSSNPLRAEGGKGPPSLNHSLTLESQAHPFQHCSLTIELVSTNSNRERCCKLPCTLFKDPSGIV